MLASMPGVDPSAGQPRLTFDWYMLNGGLKLLPVLIGVFAVSQIISDILEIGRPMERISASTRGLMMTLKDWRKSAANMLRSSLIGTWVGILPGVGASIGSVIAYTTTKTCRNRRSDSARGRRKASSPRRLPTTPRSAEHWCR